MNDADLLAAFAERRSEEALCALVERYTPLVYGACLRRLRGRADLAEDAAQAVFIVLARKAPALRRTELGPWLHRTAELVVANQLRVEGRRRRHEQEAGAMEAARRSGPQDPKDAEAWQGARAHLDGCIERLAAKQRDAVVLHYLQGLSRSQAAQRLGCSVDALNKRLAGALEKLRSALERQGAALALPVLTSGLAAEGGLMLPAGLAAKCHAQAWALGAAGVAGLSTGLLTGPGALAQSVLKTMAWLKVKNFGAAAALVFALLLPAALLNGGEAPQPVAGEKDKPTPAPTPTPPEPPPSVRVLGEAPFQAPGSVLAMALTEDGRYFATAGDKEILIWNVAKKVLSKRLKLPNNVWNLKYVMKGTHLLVAGDHLGPFDPNAQTTDFMALVEIETGKIVRFYRAPGHYKNVNRRMLFSPDELLVWMAAPGGGDNLFCWEIATGKLVAALPGASKAKNRFKTCPDVMAMNAECTRLATLSSGLNDYAELKTWTMPAGEKEGEFNLPKGYCVGKGGVAQWSSDGRTLLLTTFSRPKGTHTLFVDTGNGKVTDKKLGVCMWTADRKTLVQWAQDKFRIFSWPSMTLQTSLDAPKEDYWSFATISPDGRWYYSTAGGGSFFLVDLQNRTVLAPAGGHPSRSTYIGYTVFGELLLNVNDTMWTYGTGGQRTGAFPVQIYGGWHTLTGSADGRMLLSSGAEAQGAEVWDLARRELRGRLQAHGKHGVMGVWLSPDATLALTYSNESDALLHDLRTGKTIAKLTYPPALFNNVFFSFGLADCRFDAKGTRMFLADATGSTVGKDPMDLVEFAHPAGFSGIFDTKTGKRVAWFNTELKVPIEVVHDLDYLPAQDLVYVAYEMKVGTVLVNTAGLFRGSDGAWVRDIEDVGPNAHFTYDGQNIVGGKRTASVASGKGRAARPAAELSSVSPSGTFALWQDNDGDLHLLDARNGLEVARVFVDLSDNGPTQGGRIAWHPGEGQIAMTLKESPAVLQIDLFPVPKPDVEPAPAPQPDNLLSDDLADRTKALARLVATGEAAIPMLAALPGPVETMDRARALRRLVAKRVEAHGLEYLARLGGIAAPKAVARLEELAKGANESADFAKDALHRLNALKEAHEKRKALEHAEPLVWPVPAVVPPKEEF